MKRMLPVFCLFVLIGCGKQNPYAGFPTYDYYLNPATAVKAVLSPAAMANLEYLISKPDFAEFKKYIREKLLPALSNMPSDTQTNENIVKIVYTRSLLNAWLEIDDVEIIKKYYFTKRGEA